MRKHKWRRRLIFLILMIILGVVILTPDRKTLGPIEVETEGFIDEAKEKYQKYSTEFVEEANEAINEAVEDAVESTARNFFDSIRQAVGDFFKNLLPG